jgi:putative ABC transport system substrate-binding protein
MGVALLYPDSEKGERGKRGKASESDGFSATRGSAAAPAARCKNRLRGGFILNLPLRSHHSITSSARVASFNKPGANITGIWMVTTVLAEKRLQLLHDLVPKAELIALLVNPTSPVAEPQTRDAQAAARALGVRLTVLSAVTEKDFDQVFASLVQQRADALFVSADPFFSSRREHLVALAARHAIPTLYEFREFVEAGGLTSYGTVLRDGYYKGGNYVARILKGSNPADLPVEQIDKFELIINFTSAKALGLTVPDKLLALADEVIE